MYQIILVVHILLSLAIIGLVLIQRGKGADMGAGFGGGASQTLFGSSGSGSFLTRTTAILATAFFISCLALSYVAVHMSTGQSADYLPEVPIMVEEVQSIPATGLPGAPATSEQSIPAPVSDLPEVPNLSKQTEASEPVILQPNTSTEQGNTP